MSMLKDLLKRLGGGGAGAPVTKGTKALTGGFPIKDLGLSTAGNPMANFNKINALVQGANSAINSKTNMGKFKGLLGMLGGMGKERSKFDGLGDNNPFAKSEKDKWQQMNWML